MASGEEAMRSSVTHSAVGLESLFPVGESEQASGDANPELERLRERLQGWLSQYEPLLLWVQRLLVWERPLHSIFVALTLNTLFWLLSSTSLRPIFLLSVSLLGLMLLERWKHKLPLLSVKPMEANPVGRESVQPQLLSLPELSHHLAESYLTFGLFLQETLQYKRQNQGKFCVMVCCSCLVLMGVGHYVPGIMISYIIALSVLLWPLVVYHELIQRMYTGLEPILMKLDYSMKGDPELRKRKVKKEVEEGDEPRAETESESEEELSCFAPTVDAKTTALAMAITDSELSDEEASILESGGFSVSRATTPQLTDVSEDLDQQSVHSDPEEAFLRDLPEFPSVEEFPSLEQSLLRSPAQREAPGEGERPLLAHASLLLQHLASPLHFVNTHFNGHAGDQAAATAAALLKAAAEGLTGEEEEEEKEEEEEEEEASALALGPRRSLEALSEEIVSTAISTVVQNTLSALLRSTEAGEDPALAPFLPIESPPSALETPPAAAAAPQPPEDSDVALGSGPDDTPVQTEGEEEEEDFELLDQSELEQMDERPSPDGQAPPSDTPPSPRQPLDS